MRRRCASSISAAGGRATASRCGSTARALPAAPPAEMRQCQSQGSLGEEALMLEVRDLNASYGRSRSLQGLNVAAGDKVRHEWCELLRPVPWSARRRPSEAG